MFSNGLLNQWLATVFGNFATLSYTIASGWISPNLKLLKSEKNPLGDDPLTDDELSFISSVLSLGGLFGTLIFGWLSDRIGRKKCLILNSIPSTIGWLLIAFGTNVYMLGLARFLCGIGGGGVFAVLPVYVSEISQNDKRGVLTSFITLNQNMGILLGYICGSFLPYRVTPGIAVIFPIFCGIAFIFFPETPRYLLSIKQIKNAKESLHFFRFNKNLEIDSTVFVDEFSQLALNIEKQMCNNDKLQWSDFTSKASLKAVIISFVLITVRQTTGAFPIINYASSFFPKTNTKLSPEISSIILAVSQLIGSLLTSILVDSAGRKFLLLVSSFGTSLSLFVAGGYFYFKDNEVDVSNYKFLPLISLSGVVLFASWGLHSLAYVVIVEICYQKIRAFVSMSTTFYSWGITFSLVQYFISMSNAIGLYGTFWIFGGSCFLMIFFIIFFIPETKGKSIDTILENLGK